MSGKLIRATAIAAALAATGSASVALASGAKSPAVHTAYSSTKPGVLINVVANGTITPYLDCGADYWSGPKLKLKHGSASFQKTTKITKSNPNTGAGRRVKESVLFTATFTSEGTFTGKVHLGGTKCGEAGYTATLQPASNGGGR
jgi:hypothetical protein